MVQVDSAYNIILIGPTALTSLHVVTLISHFKIKFPRLHGIGEDKDDLNIARRCYRHTLTSSSNVVRKQKQSMKIEVELFTKEATEPLVLLTEETENIELIPGNKDKTIKIEVGLGEPLRTGLIELLRT